MSDEVEYLAERLRTAFAEDARVNELGILATIIGHKVFLRGCVGTAACRDSITIVAREVLPDHEIHNECTVARVEPPDGPEVLS